MIKYKSSLIGIPLLPFILFLTSCGDGGFSNTSSATVTYTGLTTQAVITQANGDDLAFGAYQNANTANSLGSPLSIQPLSLDEQPGPRSLLLVRTLKRSITQIKLDTNRQNMISGATVVVGPVTINGNCGGSAVYDMSVDDVTFSFTGAFRYTAYCEDGVTLTGDLTFSGSFNINTTVFGQIVLTYSNLTVTTGSDSFTANGTIALTGASSTTSTVTMDMIMEDNNTAKAYQVDDYELTITENVSSTSLEITGRYYDPDLGYVSITTETPLDIAAGDTYPSSGVIVASGANGSSGGPAKAKLTTLSNTTYQIEIDEDGDGVYEFLDTGIWANL